MQVKRQNQNPCSPLKEPQVPHWHTYCRLRTTAAKHWLGVDNGLKGQYSLLIAMKHMSNFYNVCLPCTLHAAHPLHIYIYVYKPICFGQKRLKKICNKLIANVHFLPVSFCAVVNRLPCPRQDLSVAAAKYTTVRRVKPQLITSNVSLIERSCGPPWHRHASSWPKNSHPRTHQPVCRKQVLWDRDQGLELLRTFVSLSDNRGQRKNKWTLKGSKKWGRGD